MPAAASCTGALALFLELAAIPSPSGDERAVTDRVAAELRDLGLDVDEDDAGARIDSNAGNLLCRLPGRVEGGKPLFFCAHLDTVPPQGPIEPVVEDGVVRNAAGTILGADNKSAVASMIEAARRIVAEQRPHAGIELLFTQKEEVGLVGAGAFDHTRLEAELGFVYDQAAPIGEIISGAPYGAHDVRPLPRPARALGDGSGGGALGDRRRRARGRRPAARAARRGDERERRHDHRRQRAQHRPGVVRARGGGALTRRAEGRGRRPGDARHVRLRRERRRVHARDRGERGVSGLPLPRERRDRAARGAARSSAAATEPRLALTGGGADANVFNARGIPCLNIANGMMAIHTAEEHIAADDLERMVDVTLALVEGARNGAQP